MRFLLRFVGKVIIGTIVCIVAFFLIGYGLSYDYERDRGASAGHVSRPAPESKPEPKREPKHYVSDEEFQRAIDTPSAVSNAEYEARIAASNSGDVIGAWIMMQDFVKARLKSPSTADFPFGGAQRHVHDLKDGRYKVISYVDSQNGFGAMVRTHFYGIVVKDGDKWTLESLLLQD